MKQKLTLYCALVCSLLLLAACTDKGQKNNGNAADTEQQTGLKIAVLDIDSMQSVLDFYKSKMEEFTKEQNAIQNELNSIQRNIANTAAGLQKRIANKDISDVDIANTNKRLENMQINLQKKQESLSMALMEKQQEFSLTITAMMEAFTKEYNAEAGYNLILIKSTAPYADPSMDITADFTPKFNEWINQKLKDDALMRAFAESSKQKAEEGAQTDTTK